jgi:serine acetyltransferase
VIGSQCIERQQVTIGIDGSVPGALTLGDGVIVGAGAKTIGRRHRRRGDRDRRECGGNWDVPPNAIVIGVPARVVWFTAAEAVP